MRIPVRSLRASAVALATPAAMALAAGAAPAGAVAAAAWPMPASSASATYGAIAFPSPGVGLVATGARESATRILRTTDDGTAWHAVATVRGTVEAFSFASPAAGWLWTQSRCVASSCPTALYATTHGGRTWQLEASPRGAIQAIDLTTPTVGYVESQSAGPCDSLGCGATSLWRTANGGRTWQPLSVPDLILKGFTAEGSQLVLAAGYACPADPGTPNGCRAVVLRSDNGGRTWATALTPPGDNYQGNSYGFDLSIGGANAWFEAPIPGGGSMASGIGALYRSRDGGRIWTEVAKAFGWGGKVTAGGPGFAGAPVGQGPNRAFAVVTTGAGAAEGGLALTLDGGRSWARLAGLDGRQVASAAWDGPDTIWLAGNDGTLPTAAGYLLRITTGAHGAVAMTQAVPAVGPLAPLTGPSATNLFGVGTVSNQGAVLVSHDVGAKWHVAGHIADADLSGGQFVSAAVGYAYGVWTSPKGSALGAVWRTTDGGRTWQREASGNYTVDALAMQNARDGERIVTSTIGPAAAWQKTDDGGRRWVTAQTLPWAYVMPLAAFGGGGGAILLVSTKSGTSLETASGASAPWRQQTSLTPGYRTQGQASLAANGSCAVLSLPDRLYTSRDGGRTWHDVPVTGGLVQGAAVEPGCVLVTTAANGVTRTAPMPT